MTIEDFISVSWELDQSGLVWHPEIGDEVVERKKDARVSILVDPQGLTPDELREAYLWLPTVEQLIGQIESRDGLIYHAGVTQLREYEAVIKTSIGLIQTQAETLRVALAKALRDLLANAVSEVVH
ncbi:MAG: hypothetical protein KDD69_06660 [Bdellovibrionales bacterium]|nr:hypothetical protein [Bdellovibrionales bacterium]